MADGFAGRSGRALLVVAAGVGVVVMWGRLVESVIFHPSPGGASAVERNAAGAEDVFLTTEDGVRVHAYWLPAPGATRALLFLHGNAGNAAHRLPNAVALAHMGAHVLLLDYRGYGLSEGRPSELGVYRDARAALAHLVRERGVPEHRVVVFGRSLGGAVAVDLARGRRLAGLILESTFTSVADLARGMGGPVLAGLVGVRFASDAKIARVESPILVLHGDRDTIVPDVLGRRLFALAPEPKAFEAIHGAGHNDTVQRGGAAYLHRIREFLDRVAPEPESGF